jgi:hypothetical protein
VKKLRCANRKVYCRLDINCYAEVTQMGRKGQKCPP